MSNNIQEFMGQFFSTIARQRIEKMINSQKLEVKVRASESSIAHPYGEYISIIMLWSSIGAIFLKIHFDVETARKLAAGALGKNADDVARSMALDFMKECSNGVGGFVRSLFETNQLLMGMSLPFLAQGSDEVIFKKIRDPRAYCSESVIKLEDGGEFVFTSEICLLDERGILGLINEMEKAMIEGDTVSASEGDVEFLF